MDPLKPSQPGGTRANRWVRNLAVLLALVLAFVVAISVYISTEFAEDPLLFLIPYEFLIWGGLLLPGALLYLGILELLPRQFSRSARRALAVGLTPIVAVGPSIFFLLLGDFVDYVWAFLVPSVLLYGAIVRLSPTVDKSHAETTTPP